MFHCSKFKVKNFLVLLPKCAQYQGYADGTSAVNDFRLKKLVKSLCLNYEYEKKIDAPSKQTDNSKSSIEQEGSKDTNTSFAAVSSMILYV